MNSPHPPRPRRLAGLLSICAGLGLVAASVVAEAQAPGTSTSTATGSATPVAGRPGAPIPPLRTAVYTPPGASIMRIASQRGEVFVDKGGHGESNFEPLQPATTLAAHDEVITKQGAVELQSAAGLNLRFSESAHAVLLSPVAIYLARGELIVTTRPGREVSTLSVTTPCGRTPVKAREALIRVDGNSTVVSMYDGTAFLGGYPPAGTVLQSGQSNRCVKGEPPLPARPLLPAPTWMTGSELVLVGDGGSPTEVTLRWQVVPTAQRYRVELYRRESDGEAWVSNTEASATRPQVELRELESGNYVARVYALDENSALGQVSEPHSFVLVRVGGLGLDGTIRTDAGTMPRLNLPPGLQGALLLDGTTPAAGAPTPGPHQLRVMVGGLSADARLVAAGVAPMTPPPGDQAATGDAPPSDATPETPSETPGETTAQPAEAPSPAIPEAPIPPLYERPHLPPIGSESPPLDDVLMGGVGAVPLGGIRSPWAGRYVGVRLEGTMSGSLGVAVNGRLTMRNGFGVDLGMSFLRAAVANQVTGYNTFGFGNIDAAVRTPSLRRRYVALQGILGLVMPTSTSFLDTAVEADQGYVAPDGNYYALHPDARPRGGGWRIEPALLFGVRLRSLTLSTMQGMSLRVSPDFGASYVGGLIAQLEILSGLRFLTFASWQVNYLGAAATSDGSVDSGGALGGGLELLFPAGQPGKLRIELLGRAALGGGGAAIYGRGALGLQLGYRFN